MVLNVTKISQKMKNKSLLNIEKDIIKWEKTLYCNYKKLLLKNNDLESSFDEEYKVVLKIQFWSYKFTSETYFWKEIAFWSKTIYKNVIKNKNGSKWIKKL